MLTLSSTSSSGQATFMLTGGLGKLGSSSSSRYVGRTRTEVARRWWLLLLLLLSNFWLRLPFLDWTLGECRLRWRCSRSPPLPPPAASAETVTAEGTEALLLVLVDSILVFLFFTADVVIMISGLSSLWCLKQNGTFVWSFVFKSYLDQIKNEKGEGGFLCSEMRVKGSESLT